MQEGPGEDEPQAQLLSDRELLLMRLLNVLAGYQSCLPEAAGTSTYDPLRFLPQVESYEHRSNMRVSKPVQGHSKTCQLSGCVLAEYADATEPACQSVAYWYIHCDARQSKDEADSHPRSNCAAQALRLAGS